MPECKFLVGDCREVLKNFPDNHFDSVVCDPPYGLAFMGKSWDHAVPDPSYWREILRVLKPGGHLLGFGGTRTYHRLVCAIEDSGFECRDMLAWLQGQGFPKSLNVSKAIDKLLGADQAQEWDGYGTALKPAIEPILLARKPLEGTVAQNVLKWRTGALNIDACRIGSTKCGRWPSNVILDDVTALQLDNQSEGASRFFYCPKASTAERNHGCGDLPDKAVHRYGAGIGEGKTPEAPVVEKNSHATVKPLKLMRYLVRLVTPKGGTVLDPFAGSGSTILAAYDEGFNALGIELLQEHVDIARARLAGRQ